MASAKAGAERIIEVLDEKPAVADPADPTPLGRATGALHLQRATFTYPDTERPALSGIDLRISPGEKVAVVGASGAGKTTLAKLLLRFYDPDDGRVTLDGHDLRDLSLSDLRRNVAAVLQETLVFDGTIAENIALRTARTPREGEIERAAEAADAHGFIAGPAGRATTRGWASAAGCCPAGSASGSPSRGRWSATPPSCSSTSRRPASTRSRPSACWHRCAA